MKKILIFFPNCEQGGTERVISLLSEYWINDYEVVLLTLCENDLKYKFFSNKYIVLKNYFIDKKGIVNKIKKYHQWINDIKKIIQLERPDLIMPFGEIPNFLIMLIKLIYLKKIKVIVNVRNTESIFLRSAKFGWLIQKSMQIIYSKAELVVTNSIGSREDLLKNIKVKNNIEVIYNPVRKCLTQKEDKNKQRIINIGRLNTQKAQHYLIEAIRLIENRELRIEHDYEVLIIGKGSKEKELKELVQKYNLDDKIRFLGWQDNPFYWLQNSDVFVLTSLWEGMPNVLIEAMACRCPVISFDCPSGPNEIINKPGENGILLEVGDVEGLAKSIIKVLNDDQYRAKLSQNAYQRAKDFDVEKIYLEFKNIIDKVLTND